MEKDEFYREARTDVTGPLDGVRVLDITTTWAGPMVGCMLGDLGADVIKVEIPAGEVLRIAPPGMPGTERMLSFETVNRNKRAITADLRTTEGADLVRRLCATVDVVVENFLPGTLAGWGVGYDDLKAVKPDIVYVSVSGWGQFGPDHRQIGYDPIALATGGWMALNGPADGMPNKAPTYLCDDLSGVHGALGALAALRWRDQTGEGQHVDVSLLDSLLFQSNGFLTLGAMGQEMARWGNQVAMSTPTNVFACAEGFAFIALVLDAHWRKLCELMGTPELGTDERYATNAARNAHRDDVNGLVAEFCASRSADTVAAELKAAGIGVAKVQSYAEAAAMPHVQARDMLQPTTLADGTVVPLTGPAAKFSRTPTRVRHRAPEIGEHNAAVYADIGLDDDALADLRARNII